MLCVAVVCCVLELTMFAMYASVQQVMRLHKLQMGPATADAQRRPDHTLHNCLADDGLVQMYFRHLG